VHHSLPAPCPDRKICKNFNNAALLCKNELYLQVHKEIIQENLIADHIAVFVFLYTVLFRNKAQAITGRNRNKNTDSDPF
jgi:hypothetical protein